MNQLLTRSTRSAEAAGYSLATRYITNILDAVEHTVARPDEAGLVVEYLPVSSQGSDNLLLACQGSHISC